MDIAMGKEEQLTTKQEFTTNLLLSWLKTEFALTTKRIIGFQPNTVFGLIPFGKKEITYPLKSVSAVSVSTKFHFKRFIAGLILVSFGLSSVSDSFIGGILLLAIGAFPLLNSYTSALMITNNAGQSHFLEMSILEKDKVQTFINDVNMSIVDIT